MSAQKELALKQQQHCLLMENTTTSFDDLDAVEEINLNQHNVTKLCQQQQQQQQQRHQHPHAHRPFQHPHPYFYSAQQAGNGLGESSEPTFQPISILKRVDSNKKMVPMTQRHVAEGATLPKNFTVHEPVVAGTASAAFAKPRNQITVADDLCTDIYERAQLPPSAHQQQTVRKRVQFANMPPMLSSASSDGDLSAAFRCSRSKVCSSRFT